LRGAGFIRPIPVSTHRTSGKYLRKGVDGEIAN
jgi:hypothetical protein